MDIADAKIAKLEARLRALEVIIQCMPTVVTAEVLERAQREIETRPYLHPDSVVEDLNIAQQQELATDALAEMWRQMSDETA